MKTEFVIKKMDISSGGPVVSYLNLDDCTRLGLHRGSRIVLKYGRKRVFAVVDTVISTVKSGIVGLNKEAIDALGITRNNDVVVAMSFETPKSLDYIKEKMDGKSLSKDKLFNIVKDIVDNRLGEAEIAFFISASYMRSMSLKENVWLTEAMVETGDVLKHKAKIVADKHCIGGVAGNRTTMLIVPILAAAGVIIAKTSSRSITSPAGTADTVEVLGNVNLSLDKIKRVVSKTNGCMVWGGALNLAPADDKIIRIEHKISVDPVSQLLASVLAKKKSVSATHVLIDIPVGKGAKVSSRKDAYMLKEKFERIGKALGMKIMVIITDGSEPVGNGIGPALEAKDVLYILKNDSRLPKDLKKKGLFMSSLLLEFVGKAKKGQGLKMATEILESGKAFEKFKEILSFQGLITADPEKIVPGRFSASIKAGKSGKISAINNSVISDIAKTAGNPLDKSAGIYLHCHKGQKINKNDVIYDIYAETRDKLSFALKIAKENSAYVIQ